MEDIALALEHINRERDSEIFRPKQFGGTQGESIDGFLFQFETVAQGADWNERKQLWVLPSLLQGKALDFYRGLPEETRRDMDRAADALRREFRPHDEATLGRTALGNRVKSPKESVKQFADTIREQAQRLHLGEAEKVYFFTNGLDTEMKAHVLLSRPEDLEMAIEAAVLKEAVGKFECRNDQVVLDKKALLKLLSDKGEPGTPTVNAVTNGLGDRYKDGNTEILGAIRHIELSLAAKKSKELEVLEKLSLEVSRLGKRNSESTGENLQVGTNENRGLIHTLQDQIQRLEATQRESGGSSPHSDRGDAEHLQELMYQLKSISNQLAELREWGPGNSPPSQKKNCFNCGRPGHFSRDCRFPRTGTNGTRIDRGGGPYRNENRNWNRNDNRYGPQQSNSNQRRYPQQNRNYEPWNNRNNDQRWDSEQRNALQTARPEDGKENPGVYTHVVAGSSEAQEGNGNTGVEFNERLQVSVLRPSPVIHGMVNGKKAVLLIDSGAQVTCIRKGFWEKVKQDTDSLLPSPHRAVLTVGGTESLIFGQVSTTLKIGENSFELNAQMMEFSHMDIILGQDFLLNAGAIIDFAMDSITFTNSGNIMTVVMGEETCRVKGMKKRKRRRRKKGSKARLQETVLLEENTGVGLTSLKGAPVVLQENLLVAEITSIGDPMVVPGKVKVLPLEVGNRENTELFNLSGCDLHEENKENLGQVLITTQDIFAANSIPPFKSGPSGTCQANRGKLSVGTLIIRMWLILMLACVGVSSVRLGNVFNCDVTTYMGIYAIPDGLECPRNFLGANVTTYQADVKHHQAKVTSLPIYLCTAEKIFKRCSENFLGIKDKTFKRQPIRVSKGECKRVVKTRVTPYGKLYRHGYNTWINGERAYVCKWLKTDTISYVTFKMVRYEAYVQGSDFGLYQSITSSKCDSRAYFCRPQEIPHGILVWAKFNHSFETFKSLGLYQVHRVKEFIVIPALSVGGAILKEVSDRVLTDTGYVIVQLDKKGGKERDPKENTDEMQRADALKREKMLQFRNVSREYVVKTKGSYRQDIAEGKISLALIREHQLVTNMATTICRTNKELRQVQRWILSSFPEEAASYIFPEKGYLIEHVGVGLLIHKCQELSVYKVHWDLKHGNFCYNTFPITLPGETKPYFLNLHTMRIFTEGSKINCSKVQKLWYLLDGGQRLWELKLPNSFRQIKDRYFHQFRPNVALPKVFHFDTRLLHYNQKQQGRISLMRLLAMNKDNLDDLTQFRSVGGGDILGGITKLIGGILSGIAKGGSTLLKALGSALEHGLNGVGVLEKDIVTSVGNASAEIITATGTGLSEILGTVGGIGSFLLWVVNFTIVGYLVWVRYQGRELEDLRIPQERREPPLVPPRVGSGGNVCRATNC